MENFKEIKLDDKYLFENYAKYNTNKSYEYSFTALYLWRDLCNTKYSIINNSLVVKKDTPDGTIFMMPLGYNTSHLQELVTTLKTLSSSNNIYLFGDIEDNFIEDLKDYTNFSFIINENRDSFEYVYLTKDLINLSGKKYHKKKNHYNAFINSYNYSISSIDTEKKINDCLNLLNNWHNNKTNIGKELQIETKEITDLLYNLNYLKLKSICIYVDNILVGFSIGEIQNNTAIISVERCDTNYKGAYNFINREFLIKDFSSTTYVNRQEDCGSLGLRKSKLSYHPIYLLKKYLIII